MLHIQQALKSATITYFQQAFNAVLTENDVTLNITKKEFQGDYTIVIFPLIKHSKKSPEETAQLLGDALRVELTYVRDYNVARGFLNISFTDDFWVEQLQKIEALNFKAFPSNGKKVLLEYCGPNTNKPLHIGHVRNMLLGYSMSEILKANGYDLVKANIYNDRGIAICKSMAAYIKEGKGATPESTGIKGDHFVGDYYVLFGKLVDAELRAKYQVQEGENIYKTIGKDKEVAEQETEIFGLAKSLLQRWEQNDAETVALWSKMNGWVYKGFKETFDVMGVDFQKDYFESETYKLGRDIIEEGLQKGVFYHRKDGAVAIDLTADGLDEKVLLRSDGTSIYITQDIGTAQLRYDEFHMNKMIYVVANEQDYHFKVLKLVLEKLGRAWASGIYHLSYALVESPTGRFKSREGKTADADDLIAEVLRIAEEKTKELGKIEGFTEGEAKALYKTIGMGALKYFILRVNPFKKIIFNPEESIDFHGHTGPFIQYTHARIRSVLRRAGTVTKLEKTALTATEREVMLQLYEYPNVLRAAAEKYDPSELANYVYQLAKLYNKFYNESPILNAEKEAEKAMRLMLSAAVANTISKGMKLLGMDVPEKM